MTAKPSTGTRPLSTIAARGAMVTVIGQASRLGIQLVGIVVLARLLAPEDFGLVVMVTAIIGFGELVRDFGLSNAAIQAPTLPREHRDGLFWINTGIGLILAIACFLSAPLIAALYDDQRLVLLSQALSAVFLLNGVATQYRANLAREFRFATVAAVDTVTPAIGLGAAVCAALLGAGPWALATQQLVMVLVACVWLMLAGRWLPGRPRRTSGLLPYLRYGGNLLAAQVVAYLGRNADVVVIGIRLGATDVGVYDRAFQLAISPLNQMQAPASKVAVPVLSRLQGDTERYRSFLLLGQSILMHPLIAVLAFAAAVGGPLITLALGPDWAASAIVFQILAVAAIARAASYATYWIALSRGLTRVSLYVAIVTTPLLAIGVIAGSFGGVVGVAIAFAAVTLVMWPVGIWMYGRLAQAPVRGLFVNGLIAVSGYAIAGLMTLAAVIALGDAMPNWLIVLCGAGVYALALGCVVLCWPRFRSELVAVIRSARHLRTTAS